MSRTLSGISPSQSRSVKAIWQNKPMKHDVLIALKHETFRPPFETNAPVHVYSGQFRSVKWAGLRVLWYAEHVFSEDQCWDTESNAQFTHIHTMIHSRYSTVCLRIGYGIPWPEVFSTSTHLEVSEHSDTSASADTRKTFKSYIRSSEHVCSRLLKRFPFAQLSFATVVLLYLIPPPPKKKNMRRLDRVMWGGGTQLENLRPDTYRVVFHSKHVQFINNMTWRTILMEKDGVQPSVCLRNCEMLDHAQGSDVIDHFSQNKIRSTQHLPLANYNETVTSCSLQFERLELLRKSVRTTPHIPRRIIYRPKKTPSPFWDTLYGKSQHFCCE
jgi:hypothetical protein